jgi:hypothetical protein
MLLESEKGGWYRLESSTNLIHWVAHSSLQTSTGTLVWTEPLSKQAPHIFYRAAQGP